MGRDAENRDGDAIRLSKDAEYRNGVAKYREPDGLSRTRDAENRASPCCCVKKNCCMVRKSSVVASCEKRTILFLYHEDASAELSPSVAPLPGSHAGLEVPCRGPPVLLCGSGPRHG